jgi:hypothetical protein
MNDPAATPRQRVKAAGVAARYTHAHAGGAEAPTMIVLEDKFGFKVDPELARAERDDRLRESSLGVPKKGSAEAGAIEKELEEVRKRRAERVALVKFPDGYTYGDREDDQKRLQQLYSKRCSRKKLTPEEEAEEARLAVRVLNPVKVKDVFALKGPKGRIYELEKRRVGEILTPAEEDELQDLRRRHPRIAAMVSKMNLVYDYWFEREIDIATKAGLGIGPAIRQAKDVCVRFQKIGCTGGLC